VEAVSAAAQEDGETAARPGAAPARGSLLGGLTRAFSGRRNRQEAKTQALAGDAVAAPAEAGGAPSVDPDVDLVDPALANRPLAPGSGAPDLNAIMRRVRDERGQPSRTGGGEAAKADFIA